MKNIKELSIKELDILQMQYALEIVESKMKIEELQNKIEMIKKEVENKTKEDNVPKLKITPFNEFSKDELGQL